MRAREAVKNKTQIFLPRPLENIVELQIALLEQINQGFDQEDNASLTKMIKVIKNILEMSLPSLKPGTYGNLWDDYYHFGVTSTLLSFLVDFVRKRDNTNRIEHFYGVHDFMGLEEEYFQHLFVEASVAYIGHSLGLEARDVLRGGFVVDEEYKYKPIGLQVGQTFKL